MRWLFRWTFRLTLVLLLTAVVAIWLAPQSVLPPVATFLDVSDPYEPTDYVMVLNGDPEVRPFAAAAFIKAGLAPEALLTRQRLAIESASVQDGLMLSEFEITRKILLHRGVPEKSIRVLPGEITSTAEEAQDLAGFLREHPEATVTVVTNAFHTRRARLVFQRTLGEQASRVRFAGLPRDDADENFWWRTTGGCNVYVTEYLKLVYYWFRY